MEKMRMESVDITAQNIEKIGALFPNCITETLDEEKSTAENKVYKKAIHFELLRQMLSGDIIEGDEAYAFTWVGKKAAIVEANKPIRKTLRPCKEESVNWDTTENLYIEGDNLEVLKLLQESYLGKVKMIYIDPPYNTGNDFVYRDDFSMSSEEYTEGTGQFNESGNRLFKNTDSNGRFHSDWCSMIYSRLMVARNLLSNDGAIFISIDDNEQENLKKICDEVFGESNFIAQLIWERAYAPKNDARFISNSHDYVLMYVKQITDFRIGRLPRTEEANARYSNPDNDPRGAWKSSDLSVKTYNSSCDYPITTPSGRIVEPPAGRCWSLSKNAFLERLQDNRIYFGANGDSVPSIKRFLSELKFEGMAPTSIMFYKDVGHSQEGAQEVSKMLDGGYFNGPKPQRLMKRILTLANSTENDVILDFFSGSASLAHAVMQLNAEDGGNRKFIMVQLPELTDEKSEAYKAGYKNICEIGKERIRRAGKKILEENKDTQGIESLDIGFRVLKLDESNMNEVYYSPNDYHQSQLSLLESNIKPDRTDLDLLFGCLLEWGLPLSLPYSSEQLEGCTIHNYNDGDLIACFDTNIPESVIKWIAKKQPLRAVFRDSSFADSPSKINVGEIFKLLAPDTRVKVI
ncbi:MAG: site-specific DNA-methyltransferase [Peptostreptococcaceae bacterium]|nr:site-specific DNA-methyltransferase [Peptostreptococcaceae bacterium]